MIITIVALAALTFTPTTSRNSDEVPLTASVRMSDLNLATPHGVRVAKRRLNNAIQAVCPDVDPRAMLPTAEVIRCRNKAWAQANQQLDVEIAQSNARGDVALASR